MPNQYKIVIVVDQTKQQEDEWGSPFKWDFGEWTPANEGGCTDISYDIYLWNGLPSRAADPVHIARRANGC